MTTSAQQSARATLQMACATLRAHYDARGDGAPWIHPTVLHRVREGTAGLVAVVGMAQSLGLVVEVRVTPHGS